MKKIVLIVLFGVMCSTSYAQIAWGLRAGLCEYSVDDYNGKSVNISFEAGPTAYYLLKKNFYLNSGLMFSMKNFEQGGYHYDASLTSYFIDVPIFAGYVFHIGKLALYAQAGPYIGIKVAEKVEINGTTISENLLKPLNSGLGVAAGINLNKFKFEFGYQQGLANISNIRVDELTLSSVFVGVSYIF
jgi:hypothetical protein